MKFTFSALIALSLTLSTQAQETQKPKASLELMNKVDSVIITAMFDLDKKHKGNIPDSSLVVFKDFLSTSRTDKLYISLANQLGIK